MRSNSILDFEQNWDLWKESEIENFKLIHNGKYIPQELLDQRKRDTKQMLSSEYSYIKVLAVDNEKIGIIMAAIDNDNIGFIYSIYVKDDHRKKGYGTLLMNQALSFLKSKKTTKILLNVGSDNESAISLYKKIGFRTTQLSMEYTI